MPDVDELREQARDRAPSTLVELTDRARDHNLLMLSAGLAFFGLISIGPALGVGFGLVRLLVSADAADQLSDLLQGAFGGQFGLAELFDQMEDRAGRYAGIGLLVLLWPATTLASGWTRTLDDVAGYDSPAGVRGLRGRVRGLIPGGILAGALFVLLGLVAVGAGLLGGDRTMMVALVGLGAVAVQLAVTMAIYRWLPSEKPPWRSLLPGAMWSTLGVLLATVGLGLALAAGGRLAEQFPPTLTTAIVLGLWLYAANTSLLLGAEHNAIRGGEGS